MTMSKDKYLKNKNAPIVVIFILWCLAIYMAFQTSTSNFWVKLPTIFRDLQIKDGIAVILSPILSLILTGIISPENKARLVFFRWRHALPGHRAFTQLIKSDSRINIDKLKQKLGTLPEDPKAQNTLWYSLYKNYSEVVTVREAHKNFLLARDLATISFVFAIVGPWGLLFSHKVTWVLLFFFTMFAQYLILAIVARNYGNRFVCNVVTEYVEDTRSKVLG